MTEEQVETLLNELVRMERYQQACAVACLAASGLRKSELVQLKESYFKEENIVHGMYKTNEKLRCKGSGVAGKLMYKYLSKDILQKYLDLWIEKRKELNVDIDSLFVVRKDNEWYPAKTSTVDSWMELCTNVLNIDVYCHCFRHYLSTFLSKKNVDISKIRDLLGHESSSTTEIYIDIDEEENLQGIFDFN